MTSREHQEPHGATKGLLHMACDTAYLARLFLGDLAHSVVGPWTLSHSLTLASKALDLRAPATMYVALGKKDADIERVRRILEGSHYGRSFHLRRGLCFVDSREGDREPSRSSPTRRALGAIRSSMNRIGGLVSSMQGSKNHPLLDMRPSMLVTDCPRFLALSGKSVSVEYIPCKERVSSLDDGLVFHSYLERRLRHLIEQHRPNSVFVLDPSSESIRCVECVEELIAEVASTPSRGASYPVNIESPLGERSGLRRIGS